MIRHHLSDDLLTGYSAGTLPEAFNLLVATHVSLCDDCRARLASLDALGGALLETTGVQALAETALSATLARIHGTRPAPRPRQQPRGGLFP